MGFQTGRTVSNEICMCTYTQLFMCTVKNYTCFGSVNESGIKCVHKYVSGSHYYAYKMAIYLIKYTR